MVDVASITEFVLGSFNAQVTEDGYLIYGMPVTNASVNVAIELATRNLVSLVGKDAFVLPANSTKFESYICDMACMRICINLLGLSISTHFNYKTTDLSISKNANPSIEEMLRQYEKSINQWIRLILSDHWTGVQTQDDLLLEEIINYNGVSYITRDADPMMTTGNYNRL
jgi:hypothetical protein